MNSPTISICIPTYNRAPEIKVCLDSICRQLDSVEHLKQQVEVVVSDNASSDDTETVVKSYQKQYPQVRYFKNETNIGFDRNVLNVVSKSCGEYCLTLGDDDAFLDGGIKAILDLIKKTKSDYINLNHWGYNHTLSAPIVPQPNRTQTEDISRNTLRDFLLIMKSPMQIVGTFGGMSTQVFKREPWIQCIDKDKFIGTQTIHLFVILKAFKDLPSTFMKEPTIMTRDNNLRWDSFPGLETEKLRAQKTTETAIWINELYGLSMNPKMIKLNLALRAFSNTIKGWVKKILYSLGWRKNKLSA